MKYVFSKKAVIAIFLLTICNYLLAHGYWQQKVNYKITIDFDAKKHQYTGSQTLIYTNNSPDTLYNVYYHLYFNAFQPNSMMDVRSRTIEDPDPRVKSRIQALGPDEIGYLRVKNLDQSGTALVYNLSETVLEVTLAKPILPGQSETFNMNFEGQVPIQIRRSGRDNAGGVDYSMSQWFPKMAEYDEMGWHTPPYVGREFYAPWGDYDVEITIDKNYVLAGTGILQNANEIGYGYEKPGTKVSRKGKTLTWHFKAENVHDFVWAADPEYTQLTAQVPDGPLLRFFYIPGEETKAWEKLPEYAVKSFQYAQKHYGKYYWTQYSFIQGGDGGMEYPMATLIANVRGTSTKTSEGFTTRQLESLVGVAVHESMHSWYQGMLATNESLYAWMDEGYTSFAEAYILQEIMNKNTGENPLKASYDRYARWTKTGKEEALSTHADHFTRNAAYSIASYTKGSISLEQLSYIIGTPARDKGLMRYFNEWSMKHPDKNDFIRVMEKQSRIELDWYYDYWINTTETIDYGITEVKATDLSTEVTLARINKIPMPIDLYITKTDGSQLIYYIPLGIMRGEKPAENELERIVGKDWAWTSPQYTFTLDVPLDQISKIEIDPTGRMADVNPENNSYPAPVKE